METQRTEHASSAVLAQSNARALVAERESVLQRCQTAAKLARAQCEAKELSYADAPSEEGYIERERLRTEAASAESALAEATQKLDVARAVLADADARVLQEVRAARLLELRGLLAEERVATRLRPIIQKLRELEEQSFSAIEQLMELFKQLQRESDEAAKLAPSDSFPQFAKHFAAHVLSISLYDQQRRRANLSATQFPAPRHPEEHERRRFALFLAQPKR